jgi:hypothetical protein
MRELSLSELAREERSHKSLATLAHFLRSAEVGLLNFTGVFSSNDLLSRYASQRIFTPEDLSTAVFTM